MSYAIGIGDAGPPMEVPIAGPSFTLAPTDVCMLRYRDPKGTEHLKALTIFDLAAQVLTIASWIPAIDLPHAGLYYGWVEVARVGDATFPRTFPGDGAIRWYVTAKQ